MIPLPPHRHTLPFPHRVKAHRTPSEVTENTLSSPAAPTPATPAPLIPVPPLPPLIFPDEDTSANVDPLNSSAIVAAHPSSVQTIGGSTLASPSISSVRPPLLPTPACVELGETPLLLIVVTLAEVFVGAASAPIPRNPPRAAPTSPFRPPLLAELVWPIVPGIFQNLTWASPHVTRHSPSEVKVMERTRCGMRALATCVRVRVYVCVRGFVF